jgi:hypothetical protein
VDINKEIIDLESLSKLFDKLEPVNNALRNWIISKGYDERDIISEKASNENKRITRDS